MKKQHALFGILPIALMCCFSCSTQNTDGSGSLEPSTSSTQKGSESSPIPPTSGTSHSEPWIDPYPYDEPADSTEGIDVNDFSNLYASCAKLVGHQYNSNVTTYFTDDALHYYLIHYGLETFPTEYQTDHNFTSGTVVKSKLNDEVLHTFLDITFDLNNVNDTWGGSVNLSRISKNKYKIAFSSLEEADEFVRFVNPEFKNNLTYMTYSYATIETDDENNVTRVRVYASSTQIYKLPEHHRDLAKPNWYLLFCESTLI